MRILMVGDLGDLEPRGRGSSKNGLGGFPKFWAEGRVLSQKRLRGSSRRQGLRKEKIPAIFPKKAFSLSLEKPRVFEDKNFGKKSSKPRFF